MKPTESICPHCGTTNEPAGDLGNVRHYRCRGCGWWYNKTIRRAKQWVS